MNLQCDVRYFIDYLFFIILDVPDYRYYSNLWWVISIFFGIDKYPGYKDKLTIYLTCVIFYFLLLKFFWVICEVPRNMNSYEGILMVYILIVPVPLAVYYWRIVYHTENDENSK
jgi:hypothetical protein